MLNLHKLLFFAFFLAIIVKGQSVCTIDNLRVSQSPTGKKVAGKPEFKVTVTNTCTCTALDVTLSCGGFSSTEPVDGAVLSKSGDACLLRNGMPIYGSSGFSFNYAWDRTFALKPLSANFACS